VIDPDELARHVKAHGPWLLHATPADPDAILRDGLVPGSELGVHTEPRAFFQTRPRHVYLATVDYVKHVLRSRPDWGAVFAVDALKLDPERIVPDEDLVSAAWWGHGWEGFPVREYWVSVSAPLNRGDPPGPNGEGTRAHWAATTPDFDAPEVTAKSLAHGSVGYRGRVPPEALRLLNEQARGVARHSG
jgi:hypothetical protein